jgi:hypothetical protein
LTTGIPPSRHSTQLNTEPKRRTNHNPSDLELLQIPHTPVRISRINAKLVGLASGINGRRTLEAITELAADYDAVAVDRFNLIRKRAYQIWEEQGRPEGPLMPTTGTMLSCNGHY